MQYYYITRRHDNNTTSTTNARLGVLATCLRDATTLTVSVRVQLQQTLVKTKAKWKLILFLGTYSLMLPASRS